MGDNAKIERWNVVDAADMAVSVKGILQRKINNKKMPFDFDESLSQGIEFLEEAKTGGSIICGNVQTDNFIGTLSPLRWSMNVYIATVADIKDKKDEDLYKDVTELLSTFKKTLVKIKDNTSTSPKELRDVKCFFDALASIFLSKSDPTTRSYSQSVN